MPLPRVLICIKSTDIILFLNNSEIIVLTLMMNGSLYDNFNVLIREVSSDQRHVHVRTYVRHAIDVRGTRAHA